MEPFTRAGAPRSVVRRRLLIGAAGAALGSLTTGAQALAASGYPSKPLRVVIPYPPGGPTDIVGRIVAAALADKLGQSVVIDNRPGASGMIASDATAKAPPDGYMLGFAASPTLTMSPLVQRSTLFDPRRDFSLTGLVVDYANVLLIGPQIPAKNVGELVTLARAEPGKHTFASSGTGGAPHLSAEIFQQATGVALMHVPYKGGGPAMTDLMAGRVDMLFASVLETMPYVTGGKLRALAVTGAARTRNPDPGPPCWRRPAPRPPSSTNCRKRSERLPPTPP
ncbi:hypothetical protein G6F65_015958 [Rhizopus arrhizus]|nr:hypothetical protein G6F65_015958 [Rhizopus arrhizus]